MPDLPDGWERVETDRDAYTKLIKRDAVTVPKRAADQDPFERDVVVVVTDERAGVVCGPGARQTWETNDPEAVAHALVEGIDAWIGDGGDPYGGSELDEQLDTAAKDAAVATGAV